MARATTSLPEPVSPRISTGTSEWATRLTRSITSFKPVSEPTTESLISCRPSRASRERLSASTASRSTLSSLSWRSFSRATAKGSMSALASSSCSLRKPDRRCVASTSTPTGSSSRFSEPTITCPSTPAGRRAGCICRISAAPLRSTLPSRHQASSLLNSSGVHSLRVCSGRIAVPQTPAATVSTDDRGGSSRRTRTKSTGTRRVRTGPIRETDSPIAICLQASRQTSSRTGMKRVIEFHRQI